MHLTGTCVSGGFCSSDIACSGFGGVHRASSFMINGKVDINHGPCPSGVVHCALVWAPGGNLRATNEPRYICKCAVRLNTLWLEKGCMNLAHEARLTC